MLKLLDCECQECVTHFPKLLRCHKKWLKFRKCEVHLAKFS